MYNTVAELVRLADEQKTGLWDIVIQQEQQLSNLSSAAVWHELEHRYQVMEASACAALEQPLDAPGNLIKGTAHTQNQYTQNQGGVCGPLINKVMARALSCSEANASMGRICAAPTAGACGILPATLITIEETYKLPRKTILQALATASGIGAVITLNATVSGAEGGCQAECGVAAAMAAAAVVQILGGTNQMSADACALALMNCMGLACDPVAGLVQVPCAQRNASQAVNALISADMVLAGIQTIIPADEVIDAMYRVGRSLPSDLRETSMGGIAISPTAKQIAANLNPAPLPIR